MGQFVRVGYKLFNYTQRMQYFIIIKKKCFKFILLINNLNLQAKEYEGGIHYPHTVIINMRNRQKYSQQKITLCTFVKDYFMDVLKNLNHTLCLLTKLVWIAYFLFFNNDYYFVLSLIKLI